MIRLLDFILSFFGLLFFSPLIIIIFIIGLFDTGKPIFKQKRVGKNQEPFNLFKFRTMKLDTEHVASHLASKKSVTKFGRFLRKSKLDELLQLVNVLIGDMSLVGPRPCLYNQTELIEERKKRNVYDVLPGITGLGQINSIDMSTPKLLAEHDAKMIEDFSLTKYIHYLFATLTGKGQGDRIGD